MTSHWPAAGCVRTTNLATGTIEYFGYSADGRLLQDWSNRRGVRNGYIYLGNTLVGLYEVTLAGGAVNARYKHTDALGSPVVTTDASKTVLNRTSYTPYGAPTAPVDGVGYTGHFIDVGTGLTYMQQRYYDPQVGRFLSTDPVVADFTNGNNFNRYWYANNNPWRFTDIDGRASGDLFGKDEIDLGDDYVGRRDRVPNSEVYEIHVYKRGSDLDGAVGDRDSKGLRKQEVGIVGPDGNWLAKHGHDKAPTMNLTADVRLKSALAQEARKAGWLAPKGTVDIKGSNFGSAIRAGMARSGSLQVLKTLGKSLGVATIVTGYMENLSINKACSMDPDFDGC